MAQARKGLTLRRMLNEEVNANKMLILTRSPCFDHIEVPNALQSGKEAWDESNDGIPCHLRRHRLQVWTVQQNPEPKVNVYLYRLNSSIMRIVKMTSDSSSTIAPRKHVRDYVDD